jgi:hypothetical protein
MYLAAQIRKGKADTSRPGSGLQYAPLSECFCSDYSFGELVSVDCYFVIREVGMHGRDRIFRHMATHTVVVCNLADGDRVTSVFQAGTRWRMAAHAYFVVEGSLLHSGFVGVVAGYAGESRIAISPAAALL